MVVMISSIGESPFPKLRVRCQGGVIPTFLDSSTSLGVRHFFWDDGSGFVGKGWDFWNM